MTQEAQKTIICPSCGKDIDVQDVLYHQVDEHLKKQYQDDLRKEKEKYSKQSSALEEQRKTLESEREKQREIIDTQVKSELGKRESALAKKLKEKAEEEQKSAMDELQAELKEKSSQVQELNKMSAKLGALQREKEELEGKYRAETEHQVNARLVGERNRIQKEEKEKNELLNKELQMQIEVQKKLTEEMKRKQEQGSMQSQGEVQELAIEEWLIEKFPLDTIREIKKGTRGADCLQVVNTQVRQNCGIICYESKRTKSFQSTWIEKFKNDMREENANIGVLVTEAMPSEMDRFGLKDGVWICSFDEFKGLCVVLRESLIQISTAIVTQENKGDKMGMLYDYLTNNEFRLQFEAIVESYIQMKSDLASEQRSMRGIWKKREKQIEKVSLNLADMYGSIRGIAGDAIKTIPSLEFQEDIDALEDNR